MKLTEAVTPTGNPQSTWARGYDMAVFMSNKTGLNSGNADGITR